jgi:hypothetical protein
MKAKLIKINDYYYLQELSKTGIGGSQCERTLGTTNSQGELGKLSKQNCDEIFGVVDVWSAGLEIELDKLPYTKHLDDGQYNDGQVAGFELGAEWGFNKAMELNKDKMFTLGQLITAMDMARVMVDGKYANSGEYIYNFIQQPKEIEVEIEMEVVPDFYSRSDEDGSIFTSNKKEQPKLDSEGCLILKKI